MSTAKKAAKKAADNQTEPAVEPAVLKQAREEVEAMKPVKIPKGIDEEAVAAKVKAGLTRAQAIQVLEAQAREDAKNETK